MTKLWLNPNGLSEAQEKYIQEFWQEKFEKLPPKYGKDDVWLSSKLWNAEWESTAVAPTVKVSSPEPTPTGNDELMKLVQSLSEKVKQLEEKNENPFKKWKEKYQWPRTYSYKTWKWMPVLSYTSYQKDPSYWYTYTNQVTGKLVSNHWLKLKLFNNWEIVEEDVEVNQFNNNFIRSEKLNAQVISDWSNVSSFVFNIDWKEFSVLPSVIN